ncbi:T-cell-specific guanine nucleotide triphosphate-binding protein 2-like [Ruditapes philippinarum]|uniref:T-cell-specific guanine nucleotide triphosphate-binding protein 2-like n=1 Tax=Ruditapes philippinarum TaxID=129788 RepID=UPI00295B07D1|nr:T-cell-specific guanine nucleotide triphosphate-binding protein 2-like [Ruditapes philippinarum]
MAYPKDLIKFNLTHMNTFSLSESKLKDAAMSDGWRVWKWKKKFWKLFDKPEASEPSIHKYKNELDKNGLTGLKDLLSKDVESWKSTMVHIAVTGQSGTGKSSFINSIRGLKPGNKGAALVGANETTFTCNRYEHPANKSFVVWDLPGVGTPNFPKEKYLDMVRINRYDFFIIISKDRFTELDLWLAQKIREQKKSCFFVRSNIDVTIENNARDFSKTHNEKDLLEKIRENISNEFQRKGISDQKIFLISNRALNKYDFGNLNNELLSLSDGLQKETLALSLSAVTREVMEEKEKVLTGRMPKIALSIASASTKSEQKELFKKEINFYRKQFNIDEETLSENREILFLTDDHLESFKVVFDEHKQKSRRTMKTPTASMSEMPTLVRIIDSFIWSKENTMLYIFSETALKMNLESLYNTAKTFYDAAKFNYLVKKTST